MAEGILSPAQALFKNRALISNDKSEIERLIRCVGRPGDLWPYQWVQLITFVYEFRPDFILELGRGYGNSTCAFNEVCQLMKPDFCEVLSLCISKDWDVQTLPNLKKDIPDDWFRTLTTLKANILTFDFKAVLRDKKRVVVFWDAHGFEVAEVVLGYIMPQLREKNHLIIMHDLSDTRYAAESVRYYGECGLWKGKNDWSGPKVQIGHIQSSVEQSIAAIDFCSRNRLDLHSSDESYHTEFTGPQWDELRTILGDEYVSKNGHWFWFTLKEAKVEVTFPRLRARENYLNWGVKKIGDHILPREQGPAPEAASGMEAKNPGKAIGNLGFEPLFDFSGRDMTHHLETNFYAKGGEQKEIAVTDQGIMIFPTTPQDHLATRFFPVTAHTEGEKNLLKVSITIKPGMEDRVSCGIFLQDSNFNMVSGDLLSNRTSGKDDSEETINYVELGRDITEIRVLINFEEGRPSRLPDRIRIERGVFGKSGKSGFRTFFRKIGKK